MLSRALENTGKLLLESTLALLVAYYILPRVAMEYNYRFHLQRFLDKVEVTRNRLDGRFLRAGPDSWETIATDATRKLNQVIDMVVAHRTTSDISRNPKGELSGHRSLVQRPTPNISPRSSRPGDIIGEARKWLGTQYRWGGRSRMYGTDCSGFVQSVYAASYVHLPRTAAEQFRIGVYVPKAQLLPADLVFFSTYAPGPSHVGIYVGNGKFIHASSSAGRVRLDSLSDRYYRRRYIAGKRVISRTRDQ